MNSLLPIVSTVHTANDLSSCIYEGVWVLWLFLQHELGIDAAGQKHAQVCEFRCLGGPVTENGDLTHEINQSPKWAARGCLKMSRELFDRRSALWRPKVQLMNAEVMEALLEWTYDLGTTPPSLRLIAYNEPPAPAAGRRIPLCWRHQPTATVCGRVREDRQPMCGSDYPTTATPIRDVSG